MSLGGSYQDHHKDMFKDLLLHEAQQAGSRLEQAVMLEMMEGNKTYFDKLGSSAHYVKTSRGQEKSLSALTFERRQVQEQMAEFDHLFDREDLIKYVQNPRNEVIKSAVWELGRRKDEIIMDAISGNSVVTTNGSTANQALTLTVAVDDHSFDSGSGDVGLTTAKLKKALTLMEENYGNNGSRLICIAPARQLINLTTENQQVSGDFRASRPLEGPGAMKNLSGFMGIDFIAYEGTGTDANSDEKAFLITEDAVKLGIYLPLTVEVDRDVTRAGNPDVLSVFEAVGATRMYEEKVVQIACDPLA